MTNPYARHVNKLTTPQGEKAREDQVQNNAGGHVFEVDNWNALHRFLILGSEGGTFYVDERKLTKQNAARVEACIREDGRRAVDLACEISKAGRAPKNDPAIFVLALAAAATDPDVRSYALVRLGVVCRTPTHLFHFLEMAKGLRGWGAALRNAVAEWYASRDAKHLAYQMAKYKSRDGWSHRDALLLSHAKAPTDEHQALYRWATVGLEELEAPRRIERRDRKGERLEARTYGGEGLRAKLPELIPAMRELELEAAKIAPAGELPAELRRKVVDFIGRFGLTHEMIPTQAKRHADVWEALLEKMPLTAMIRNLANMTRVGLLEQLSTATGLVCSRLQDAEYLKRSRVHPIQVLIALKVYERGTPPRRPRTVWDAGEPTKTWEAVPQIVDALDEAFYACFGNVAPVGKKTLYALDVSGSMDGWLSNMPLTHAEVGAALLMVLMRTEPEYAIVGFADGLRNLGLSPRMRLDDVVRKTNGLSFGATDCSLPATFARQKEIRDLEAVVIVTDNETWFGSVHPYQALEAYRRWSGTPTRQVVLATAATPFTIADPRDPLSLDVVGFDTAVPNVIGEFLRGKIG